MIQAARRTGSLEGAHRLLERSLDRGSSVRLTVQGSCMLPLLKDGDEALVSRAARFRTGEVVLARNRDGDLVCHRILASRGSEFLLAGDRSTSAEAHSAESVLGRVIEIRRQGAVHRFDRGWRRWFDVLAARLHLISHRGRERKSGRLVDAIRRRFLTLGARIVWD